VCLVQGCKSSFTFSTATFKSPSASSSLASSPSPALLPLPPTSGSSCQRSLLSSCWIPSSLTAVGSRPSLSLFQLLPSSGVCLARFGRFAFVAERAHAPVVTLVGQAERHFIRTTNLYATEQSAQTVSQVQSAFYWFSSQTATSACWGQLSKCTALLCVRRQFGSTTVLHKYSTSSSTPVLLKLVKSLRAQT
jgi:hypothetical protein